MQPEALKNRKGRAAAVMLSQPVLGHDVVFSVGVPTSEGSCSWRNLFSFVPCFHALSLSPLLMKTKKSHEPQQHIFRGRKILNNIYSKTVVKAQNRWTLVFSPSHQYLLGCLSVLFIVVSSAWVALCGIYIPHQCRLFRLALFI